MEGELRKDSESEVQALKNEKWSDSGKLNASNKRYFTHLSHHLTESPE